MEHDRKAEMNAACNQSAGAMRVSRTLHMENARVSSAGYISRDKPILCLGVSRALQGPSSGSGTDLLVSDDNGGIWRQREEWALQAADSPQVVQRGPAFYCDSDNGRLLEFHVCHNVCGDGMTFGPGDNSYDGMVTTRRWYYRVSADEGRTWSPKRQLIQHGCGFDDVHWAAGIWYGKNSAECHPAGLVKTRDGTLILPATLVPLDPQGRILRCIDRFGGQIYPEYHVACFRGRWREDLTNIDWELSNPLSAPEYLALNLCEPTVASIDDKTLMMVMRATSGPRQALPGVKFFSLSRDSGQHWGPVVPLTYPDGSYVHSPASYPELFRSSRTGRVYLIANILDRPCKMCDPRHPLCIAEISPKYFWVLPKTVAAIETRKPNQHAYVRFSNWASYEDRQNGHRVLFMTESRIDSLFDGLVQDGDVSPHAWRYEIELPT